MDIRTRKEYAAVVKERYWKACSKKAKSLILHEYCANTGQATHAHCPRSPIDAVGTAVEPGY